MNAPPRYGRAMTAEEAFRIESLLSDLAPLDDGYGDAIARESPDIAANVARSASAWTRPAS